MSDVDVSKMDLENLDKPRRRFVGLTVREVSLVDSGANEREFAIIKRKGGQEMAEDIKREKQKGEAAADVVKQDQPDNDTVEPTKDDGKQEQPTETAQPEAAKPEAQPTEVEKLATEVQKLLGKVEALEKAGCGGGGGGKGKDTKKADETETNKAGVAELMAQLKAAKAAIDKADTKTAMAAIDAAMKILGTYSGGGYMADSKKAAEDTDVEKAGAKMSKARVEKLDSVFKTVEAAFTTLKELLADVQGSVEDTKKAADTTIVADGDKAAEQIKAAVEPVTKALTDFTEQIKQLSGRVDSIEKARGASKAAEDGQEDVAKRNGKGGFWAGTPVAGIGAKAQQ